jgi:energy-converting hydrogenase Eha subunit C
MKTLQIVYGLGIGFLLAALVGVGIIAFYDPPQTYYGGGVEEYGRNVLIISYLCGLFFGALGLVLSPVHNMLRLGLLSGGFFTLLYSMTYPILAGAKAEWIFGTIFFALIVLILLGVPKLKSRRTSRIADEE